MAQRDQDIIPGVSLKTRLSKPGILVREIAFGAEINQSTDRMVVGPSCGNKRRSEEHTSELQSRENLVCRLLLEKKNHNSNDIRSNSLHHATSGPLCDEE